MSALELGDPLAHRALQALLRAEATVRKRLALQLEREGVTAAGFSVLVVLTTAGGSLELKTLRRRLGWSKANATEVTGTLAGRGFVSRRRAPEDRRVVVVDLEPVGRSLVERLFPAHSERVQAAFDALDEGEKRTFSELCRKLAA
jgi:MarR family transcriptional regulator, 2-MHQ and catechol-resistance regulon repressor